jgi:hypothetical protein
MYPEISRQRLIAYYLQVRVLDSGCLQLLVSCRLVIVGFLGLLVDCWLIAGSLPVFSGKLLFRTL